MGECHWLWWIEASDAAELSAVHGTDAHHHPASNGNGGRLRNPDPEQMIKVWVCALCPNNSLKGILQNPWLAESLETGK